MHRILFFPEAASLAHVGRPIRLAETLDPAQWEVHFACADRYRTCFDGREWPIESVQSVDPLLFLKRLKKGAPLFTSAELEAFVAADLSLLERLKPDAVVGDLRLSLAVAARAIGIPYANICNAHWSPWANMRAVSVPDLAMLQFLGERIGQFLFRLGYPIGFRLHARPINRLRRRYGQKSYPDVRWAYTDGDATLYADPEVLVPAPGAPPSHCYVGPLVWSPTAALPSWWDAVPDQRPLAYVTLGSTGRADLLPTALNMLEKEGYATIVATAGRADLAAGPNRFVASFLPGELAADRAELVVCNGGSATAYQALLKGRPVLGLYGNLDQALTMMHVSRAGAGVGIRAGAINELMVSNALRVLRAAGSREKAEELGRVFSACDVGGRFAGTLARLVKN